MKKVFLCIAIFLVSGIAVFSTFALMDINTSADRSESFSEAMKEYRDELENTKIDSKKIQTMVENIKSEDDFAIVEKAAKEYLRDVYLPISEARAIQKKGIYKTGISIDLLKNDAPEFSDSYTAVNSMQTKLDEIQAVVDKLFDWDAALAYLPENADKKLVSLYKEEVESTYSDTILKQSYQEYVEHIASITSHYRTIIDFLETNASSWYIEEDTRITFKTTKMSEQFEALANELESLNKK